MTTLEHTKNIEPQPVKILDTLFNKCGNLLHNHSFGQQINRQKQYSHICHGTRTEMELHSYVILNRSDAFRVVTLSNPTENILFNYLKNKFSRGVLRINIVLVI